MYLHTHDKMRRAATVIECAVVLPTTFTLLFSLVIGAMGVFRYHETSTLAREGARYASTHGYQYRKDAGLEMGNAEEWSKEIYEQGIKPRMISLDPARVTYKVSWPDVINQPGKPDNWPGSKVEVTVTYTWIPEWRLSGPITLTSTSSMPITN